MRTKTITLLQKRLIKDRLVGISLHIDKPTYGIRFTLEVFFEKLIPGSSLWQIYKKD